MKLYDIEAAIVALEAARDHGIKAGLGEGFTNEVAHLLAMAAANREELREEERK